MDYLIFLTGLFLLVAGAGCLFHFREDRLLSRWPLLTVALTAFSFKIWFGILAFAFGWQGLANLVHAWLGAGFAAALLGFCLSPIASGNRATRGLKFAAITALWALTFGAGTANPNGLAFIIPLVAVTAAGAWQIGKFSNSRPGTQTIARQSLIALLLTAIVTICLLPDAVATCYDVAGQGLARPRIAMLGAFAAAALGSGGFCWSLWSPIYRANHDQLPAPLVRRRRVVTAVLLVAAGVTCSYGAWLAHWLGNQAYQEKTATILSALRLGASNLEVTQLTQFQGVPAEVESTNYKSVQAQLRQICSALPGVRFTYLLGMRNQQLVFLVDAEDPANEDTFSPPGEPVADYPEKWQDELAGAATFKGPDPDEWGVWFAACVPICDPGGELVALLGIDYPAATWLRPLAARRVAGMGVTLSVAVLIVALFGAHVAAKEGELNLLHSRAAAERLALLAKRTDNGVVITNREGRIEWINEGFTKISGYSKEEVLGRTPGSFLQREGDNTVERIRIRACVRAGTGFETELVNYRKSGHAYIVHIECHPLTDNQGTVTGFMAIQRNVTQARRSNSLLEAVAAMNTTLLSSRLEASVWSEILAALGAAANADRCYLFRIHLHPVLGTPAMSPVAEWNSAAASPQLNNPDHQNFLFHENGYSRWLAELQAGHAITGSVGDCPASEQPMLLAQEIRSLVVVPIFTGEDLTGFMGFDACHEDRVWENWEISILRSAAANIGLRQVVQNEAQALELARDEARSAASAAETASRAKSAFLATMSHEIRTPLNAVIGMASLLEASPLDANQRDIAETILNSSNFLLDLITGILDYSRIESGHIDLEAAPFILADVCREAFDVVRPEALGKPLELSCHFAAELPTQVEGDRSRLRQILVNLLGNAVKFTPAGSVSLTVAGQPDAGGAWQLSFEVKDSGIGISPEVSKRLFTPFVQADSSTTRRFGGSGLGLAISTRLATAMGGKITVHSIPGEGSTFRLALTLQPALNLAPAPAPAPPDEFDAARFATLNLLVAEDNLNNQKVIRLLLQRLGIEPDCVANGHQAVAAARTKAYDIIILDLHMPVMDGLEASRAIRALKLAKQPLMVALTANAFQEDHDAAVAAGMDEYLTKPITLTRLRQLLAKLTQAIHGPPEPTAPTSSPEPAPTGPPELPPLIDLRQIETLVDLGWADYLDVLGELTREVPVYLADIRTLIVAGDAPALKRRIHSFRGGLACFGCVAMTARLAKLELGEVILPAQADALQAELEALWEQSLGAIKEWEKSVASFHS